MVSDVAVVASSAVARAQEVTPDVTPRPTTTTLAPNAWLYADDARIPAKDRVIAVSRVTTTDGGDASRPFASDLAHPGSVLEAGAEVGLGRDLAGHAAVFTRASFAADVGRFRIASTLLGEHVYAPGRDAVDMLVSAGVAYALPNAMRLGVEWVAQDVEGAFDATEKEGIRHFVGPTFGWTPTPALSIAAGPAVGLSYGSPRGVGRLAVVYAF
jgi:hypothetical protein